MRQNTAGAAAATHLPPLPSPPPCTAAESRPLAERPPARLRHDEQGRDGGGGRMAGIPVFPGRPEKGEEGRRVTWSRHQAQPDWRVPPRSQPELLWFPGTEQPPPLFSGARARCGGPAPSGAGVVSLCIVHGCPWHGPHCRLGGLIASTNTSLFCSSPAFPHLPLFLPSYRERPVLFGLAEAGFCYRPHFCSLEQIN